VKCISKRKKHFKGSVRGDPPKMLVNFSLCMHLWSEKEVKLSHTAATVVVTNMTSDRTLRKHRQTAPYPSPAPSLILHTSTSAPTHTHALCAQVYL
jgi:hypothetical protein